jgi:tetratricopeptide (TPR) repeat protein
MGVLDQISARLAGDPIQKAFRLRERGKSDRAIDSLKKFHEARPDNLAVSLHLAAFLMEADDPDQALDTLRHAFQQDADTSQEIHILVDRLRIPRDRMWPIHLVEGETAIRRNDLSTALRHLEKIPTNTRERLEKRYLGRYRQSLPKDESKPLERHRLLPTYLAALIEESLGRVKEAQEIYTTLLARNPDERDNVARRFEALLATDYRNLDLRIRLGELNVELDRIEPAIQEFNLALELEAGAAESLAPRLQSLLDKGHDHHALRWLFLQASTAGGLDSDALHRIEQLADEGLYVRESIHLLSERLKEDFAADPALLLARLYLRFGRAAEAMEWIERAADQVDEDQLASAYEQVIHERPDSPAAYFKLADLCLRRDRSERAMELFRALTEKDSSHDSLIQARLTDFVSNNRLHDGAQRILAELLLRKGETAKAIVVYRHLIRVRHRVDPNLSRELGRLIEARPDEHHLRLAYAESLAAEKQPQQALKQLSLLTARAPHLAPEFLHLLSELSLADASLAVLTIPVFQKLQSVETVADAVVFGSAQAVAVAGRSQEALDQFRRMVEKWPARQEVIEEAIRKLADAQPDSPEIHYAVVEMALRRRDYRAATETLRSIKVHDPEKYPRVLKMYIASVSRDSDNLDARSGLSSAYLAGRYYRRVLALGKETLALADDESTASFRVDMGDAFRELGDFAQASRMFLSAFQADQELASVVLARVRELARKDPTIGQIHLTLGVVSLHLGNLEDGIASLLEAWRQEPKRGDQVLQQLEKLCSLNPTIPSIPLAMVTLLRETGQEEKGIHILGEVLDCAPRVAERVADELKAILRRHGRSASAWFQLGRCYQILGDAISAVEAYEKGFQIDSSLGRRILTSLRQLSRENPGDPVVCRTLGILCAESDRPLEAARWIQRAIEKTGSEKERYLRDLERVAERDPENAQILLILGTEYGRLEQMGKAIPCYETALSFDESLHQEIRICVTNFIESGTDRPAAHLVRFRTWIHAKRPHEAVADLRNAARHGAPRKQVLMAARDLHQEFPDNCEALIHIVDLLIGSGESRTADAVLRKSARRKWKPAEKIALLLRKWRIAHTLGNLKEAADTMREAESITPDRNQLFGLIHRFLVHQTNSEAQALEEAIRQGERQEDLPNLIRHLVDLGESPRAVAIASEFRDTLGEERFRKLAAAAWSRDGQSFRAVEPLTGLDPSLELSLAAEKCGNLPLAAATMERILEDSDDPVLQQRLQSYFHGMALSDLRPGGEKLVGETILNYND